MKPTEALAGYVAETKFGDFPQEVVLKAKYCILDSVGCALGGAQTNIGQQHIDMAKALGGKEESTVIGDGTKVSMITAAYTNAQLSNVLDFDDAVIPVPGHPGIAAIYPALAAGERIGASGKDIITAVILGYEVGLRVAHACRSVIMPAGDNHPQLLMYTAYKVFSAATSAGKMLKLGKEELINAFGIAGGIAPGTPQPTSMTTRQEWGSIKANYGVYALLGTLAAIQAERGLYAHKDILDGDEFWTKTGANTCDYFELTRGLGSEYLIMEVGFKPVPSCRGTHPQLTAVIEALNGESIDPSNIDEIVLTGGRMLPGTRWDNMFEAEFKTACAISLYLYGVEPGPAWYLNDRFKEPDILDLAKKIKFVEEEEYWGEWVRYGKLPAAAEVKTKDGQTRRTHIEYPKGEPQNPLTEEEHRRKFAANTQGIIGEEQSERLYDTLIDLENASANELMSLTYPK